MKLSCRIVFSYVKLAAHFDIRRRVNLGLHDVA
jgi:hypothetical protein